MFHQIIFLLTATSILWLSGCTPNAPKERYNLAECKEELLEATDYTEADAIDRIVVIKKERKMYLYKEGRVH